MLESSSSVACKFSVDWTSSHVCDWRRWFAPYAGLPGVHGLEVGVAEGRTSLWLLDHVLTDAGQTLTCVDPLRCEDWASAFSSNTRMVRDNGRLVWYPQSSLAALPAMLAAGRAGFFSLIYLDGYHEASVALSDMCAAWQLLAPGGIVIIDDLYLKLPVQAGPSAAILRWLPTLGPVRIEAVDTPPFGQVAVWKARPK